MRVREWQSFIAWYKRKQALQDPSSPLLKSDVAFQLYLSALMKNGYEASINSAVRRRDSILASLAVTATETSEVKDTADAASTNTSPSSVPASETPSPATSSQTEPQTSNASPISSSQKIAQAVLSGETAQLSLTPDMARLSAALSAGSGGPGNPIVVTLSERK